MRRIAVINQKGGVGKTTSCCNIGAAIAASGQRVLLIDLDPQAHLTMHLGIEPEDDQPNIYDVLTDKTPITEAVVVLSEHLHVLPSHIDLAAAEMELISVMGRERLLRDALAAHEAEYDYVLIDCPPSLGILTINGLAAMDEVFVPMQPHFLALQGLGKLFETIGLVRQHINPALRVSGVILCMYDAGTRLAGEVSSDIAAFLTESRGQDVHWSDAVVFQTIIRRNIKLAECPSHGQSIFTYAPSSNGSTDYAALAAEILGDPHQAEAILAAHAVARTHDRPAVNRVAPAPESPPEQTGPAHPASVSAGPTSAGPTSTGPTSTGPTPTAPMPAAPKPTEPAPAKEAWTSADPAPVPAAHPSAPAAYAVFGPDDVPAAPVEGQSPPPAAETVHEPAPPPTGDHGDADRDLVSAEGPPPTPAVRIPIAYVEDEAAPVGRPAHDADA